MKPSPPFPSGAFAQWVERGTLLWNASAPASARYGLEYVVPDGNLRIIPLIVRSKDLPTRLRERYPHLTQVMAFDVGEPDTSILQEALRCRLTATARSADGYLIASTGVQIPGVIDDLYAGAGAERLGQTADRQQRPRLAVWAPTARSVSVNLYSQPSGGSAMQRQMCRDDTTGVWSVTGNREWWGCYYTYSVEVYVPTVGIVTNEVTDPYSVGLSADSVRSLLVDLADPALAPPGWTTQRLPKLRPEEAAIYELHVRDFSAADVTVPESLRGTYAAFTIKDSAGTRALSELAAAGLTHVQLMPVCDFGSVPDRRSDQIVPLDDFASMPADSAEQQARSTAVSELDSYDWGYDTLHFMVPEGSYATNPDGPARIKEFRAMIAALHEAGLRVVMDVVFNHVHAAEQDPRSVLDRIVPGYYQRLRDDGTVSRATSCPDTAPEHLMMAKLVCDAVLTWVQHYHIDGFRFDLMGFHPKANILAVREALDAMTSADGAAVLLYGEGWNFGEGVANDARFVQATQHNLAGTGIGTFNDHLRDAVRGGTPLDTDPRRQGFGTGLFTAPNGAAVNGTPDEQRARLLHYQEIICAGLTGNLRNYAFLSGTPATPDAAYNAEPGEAISYVDCHDNETLFDALAHKLPIDTPMADRVRMHSLSLAVALLSQGPALVLAGSERLRSKSLDRNSYNSGDWFNRLLWNSRDGNGFAAGLPPAADNRAYWEYDKRLLADPLLRPSGADIDAAVDQFKDLLRIRRSSRAFSIGSASEINRRVSFPTKVPPGIITMRIDTAGLDPHWDALVVIINATPHSHTETIDPTSDARISLHPIQAKSRDQTVRKALVDGAMVRVPARTVAIFTVVDATKRPTE